jgi:hypothetical protein
VKITTCRALLENNQFQMFIFVIRQMELQQSSTHPETAIYPEPGYPDRLGPSSKQFLPAIVLQLFMA